jgi:phage terminase large subunit-like protein
LHLNIWTSSDVRWLDMEQWDACRQEDVELEGRICYGGLDLASKSDMAAFALVFAPLEPGDPYHVRVWYWIPGDNVERRALQTGVPYDVWARQELLKGTPGNVIDYDTILADVLELAALYDVREVAFDRWGATLISQQMTEAGLLVVEFGQGFASMAAPMREIMRLVANGDIAHDGNPILRWNVDNVSAEQDAAGNLKPSKRKSAGKIDGMVAVVMGLDRALRNESAAPYYAEGGLVLA